MRKKLSLPKSTLPCIYKFSFEYYPLTNLEMFVQLLFPRSPNWSMLWTPSKEATRTLPRMSRATSVACASWPRSWRRRRTASCAAKSCSPSSRTASKPTRSRSKRPKRSPPSISPNSARPNSSSTTSPSAPTSPRSSCRSSGPSTAPRCRWRGSLRQCEWTFALRASLALLAWSAPDLSEDKPLAWLYVPFLLFVFKAGASLLAFK